MTIKTLDSDEKSVDGQPHYMRTLVFLDDTGHLQVRTNTYSHVWFTGFHGGVVVCLTDRSGKLLYATPPTAYGVDGSQVPFGTSNRWDTEDYNVGPTVALQTDRIDVILYRAPDTNLAGFLKTLQDVIKAVEDAYTIFRQIWDQITRDDTGLISSGTSTGIDNDTQTGVTQVTEEALTGAPGTLITAVNPAVLTYGQQATFTVSATDSKTGTSVDGLVYKSLSLPLDQGATLLGTIGQPISATLSGRWSLRPRIVQAQLNPAVLAAALPMAALLPAQPGSISSAFPSTTGTLTDVSLTRPQFVRPNLDAVSIFVPENLYVRTRDYGDVAVPFVLTGRPDGSA